MAAQATLHCLTGCAIGEVLGMVIGTAAGFHNAGTIVLSTVLAFIFGYALTMRGVIKSGLSLGAAFKVALAADTVSIAVMELIDNTVIVAIPARWTRSSATGCSGRRCCSPSRSRSWSPHREPMDDQPRPRPRRRTRPH